MREKMWKRQESRQMDTVNRQEDGKTDMKMDRQTGRLAGEVDR